MTLALLLLACLPEMPVADGDAECSAFLDMDGDGFGADEWLGPCEELPAEAVDFAGDCEDDDAAVNPDADEVCDGIDNNCDGSVDETSEALWYADEDGDGWGAGDSVVHCDEPGEGWSQQDGDCDDADPGAYPDAPVECSGFDRNCDDVPDDLDADGDGYAACEECDDADASIHPDASETCDGIDQDCDGILDNDPTDGVPGTATRTATATATPSTTSSPARPPRGTSRRRRTATTPGPTSTPTPTRSATALTTTARAWPTTTRSTP